MLDQNSKIEVSAILIKIINDFSAADPRKKDLIDKK